MLEKLKSLLKGTSAVKSEAVVLPSDISLDEFLDDYARELITKPIVIGTYIYGLTTKGQADTVTGRKIVKAKAL